jgi:GTPase SAR1 family protein
MIQFRAPASSAMDGRTFNCFVAGDENAGKTSLIRRILGGDFDSDHTKTQSIHEYVKTFASSAGTIKFRLFDFPADKVSDAALR